MRPDQITTSTILLSNFVKSMQIWPDHHLFLQIIQKSFSGLCNAHWLYHISTNDTSMACHPKLVPLLTWFDKNTLKQKMLGYTELPPTSTYRHSVCTFSILPFQTVLALALVLYQSKKTHQSKKITFLPPPTPHKINLVSIQIRKVLDTLYTMYQPQVEIVPFLSSHL